MRALMIGLVMIMALTGCASMRQGLKAGLGGVGTNMTALSQKPAPSFAVAPQEKQCHTENRYDGMGGSNIVCQ